MKQSSCCQLVSDTSQVGVARRAAQDMAIALGFDDTAAGRVAIVTTEMATNLVKHAGSGRILMRETAIQNEPALELLSLDSGPGIVDVSRSLQDGYSTGGSPGNGLGAIRRLSTVFDIYSKENQGTVVLSQHRNKSAPLSTTGSSLCLGSVNLPIKGESQCGDSWAFLNTSEGLRIIVADGLGHGPKAAEASMAAVSIFQQNPGLALSETFRIMQGGLRATRGAAVAICELNRSRRMIRFVGIGNISGLVLASPSGISKHFVSGHGTVGQLAPKILEFDYPWNEGEMVFLHSDGLQGRWSLDKYPGLQAKHPSLVAGTLFRDFNRGSDDTTVVVGAER